MHACIAMIQLYNINCSLARLLFLGMFQYFNIKEEKIGLYSVCPLIDYNNIIMVIDELHRKLYGLGVCEII